MTEEMTKCPVAITVSLIGSKWRVFVLRDLMSGPKRFGELRRSIAGISHKVLADNLRNMENDGLIARVVFESRPAHIEYRLTDLGETMRPILQQLEIWGKWYKDNFNKTNPI